MEKIGFLQSIDDLFIRMIPEPEINSDFNKLFTSTKGFPYYDFYYENILEIKKASHVGFLFENIWYLIQDTGFPLRIKNNKLTTEYTNDAQVIELKGMINIPFKKVEPFHNESDDNIKIWMPYKDKETKVLYRYSEYIDNFFKQD